MYNDFLALQPTICARITGMPDCEGVTLALPHLLGGQGVLGNIPMLLDGTDGMVSTAAPAFCARQSNR